MGQGIDPHNHLLKLSPTAGNEGAHIYLKETCYCSLSKSPEDFNEKREQNSLCTLWLLSYFLLKKSLIFLYNY